MKEKNKHKTKVGGGEQNKRNMIKNEKGKYEDKTEGRKRDQEKLERLLLWLKIVLPRSQLSWNSLVSFSTPMQLHTTPQQLTAFSISNCLGNYKQFTF